MKKIFYIFLYISIVCFCFFRPLKVNAYLTSVTDSNKIIHKKEVDDRKYLLLCSYVHKSGHNASQKDILQRINIYYTNEGKWLVSWDNISMDIHGNNYYNDKLGTSGKVFSNTGNNVYIADNTKNALINEGKCPSLAWVDNSNLLGSNEICIGGKNYCKSRNNIGTKFVGKNTESKKNYDISDTLETWFTRNSPTISNCEELRNKKFDLKKQLETDILKNFLNISNTENVPSFFSGNSAYKKGMTNLDKKIESFKNKCDTEVKNDSSLNDKQKEDLLKKNQEGLNTALSQTKKVKEEIEDYQIKIALETGEINCKNIFNGRFGSLLKQILSLIRFAVPLLIIGLSVVDFIKIVATQRIEDLRKASIKFVQRLIIGAIIFLLPTLLDILLKLAEVEFGVCDLG